MPGAPRGADGTAPGEMGLHAQEFGPYLGDRDPFTIRKKLPIPASSQVLNTHTTLHPVFSPQPPSPTPVAVAPTLLQTPTPWSPAPTPQAFTVSDTPTSVPISVPPSSSPRPPLCHPHPGLRLSRSRVRPPPRPICRAGAQVLCPRRQTSVLAVLGLLFRYHKGPKGAEGRRARLRSPPPVGGPSSVPRL